MTKEEFIRWVKDEMDRRNWKQVDLSEHSGISTAQVSRVLHRKQFPGMEFCLGVAKAFDMPETDVIKRAGFMPKEIDKPPRFDELLYWAAKMPPEELEELIETARLKDELRKRREARHRENPYGEAGEAGDSVEEPKQR